MSTNAPTPIGDATDRLGQALRTAASYGTADLQAALESTDLAAQKTEIGKFRKMTHEIAEAMRDVERVREERPHDLDVIDLRDRASEQG